MDEYRQIVRAALETGVAMIVCIAALAFMAVAVPFIGDYITEFFNRDKNRRP